MKSKTRRLRSALRIVIQEYGDRNGLNQPQSASDARARTTTNVQIGLPRRTDFATVQDFVQLPPVMFGFSE